VLRLLTDADITPKVARAVRTMEATCPILSVRDWEGGKYGEASDEAIILAAQPQGLTLITRDTTTIPRLLDDLFARGLPHAGVIFVAERPFPRKDIGRLARALVQLWLAEEHADWTNRVRYVSPAD